MKKIRQIAVAIFMAATLLLGSCSLERQMEKVSIGDIERMEMRGMTASRAGFDLFLNASNMSNKNIALKDMRIDLKSQGERVMTVYIQDEVKLPKRWEGEVKLPVMAQFNGSVLLLAMIPRMLERATVDIDCVIKAGGMRKRFRMNDMSLKELMRMSGLELPDDMDDVLKEYM